MFDARCISGCSYDVLTQIAEYVSRDTPASEDARSGKAVDAAAENYCWNFQTCFLIVQWSGSVVSDGVYAIHRGNAERGQRRPELDHATGSCSTGAPKQMSDVQAQICVTLVILHPYKTND